MTDNSLSKDPIFKLPKYPEHIYSPESPTYNPPKDIEFNEAVIQDKPTTDLEDYFKKKEEQNSKFRSFILENYGGRIGNVKKIISTFDLDLKEGLTFGEFKIVGILNQRTVGYVTLFPNSPETKVCGIWNEEDISTDSIFGINMFMKKYCRVILLSVPKLMFVNRNGPIHKYSYDESDPYNDFPRIAHVIEKPNQLHELLKERAFYEKNPFGKKENIASDQMGDWTGEIGVSLNDNFANSIEIGKAEITRIVNYDYNIKKGNDHINFLTLQFQLTELGIKNLNDYFHFKDKTLEDGSVRII